MNSLFEIVRRNALLLAVVALASAALLAGLSRWAGPVAEQNRAAALRNTLAELVPAQFYDEPLDRYSAEVSSPLLGEGAQQIYRAKHDGKVTTVLITAVAADGYNGDIRLLSAVNGDRKLLGVRVLEHRETPGLGDAIEFKKSDWIHQFEGRSLVDPVPAGWQVAKDGGQFDQITAATITPRAVVGAVRRQLEYVDREYAQLFQIGQTGP